jgi:hypothetical protein
MEVEDFEGSVSPAAREKRKTLPSPEEQAKMKELHEGDSKMRW